MTSRIERFLIAVIFALLAAGVTLIVASAQDGNVQSQTQFTTNCAACHTEFQMTWENGPHGKAGSDPVFLDEWTKQGKPSACLSCHTTGFDPATATYKAEGVTCEACHGPVPLDHPKNPMPINTSPDLCGSCHSDTRFGWQDWKVSTHYQRGMDCATCHDPHSASLKNIAGSDGDAASTDNVSALCVNCHKEHNTNYSFTTHNQNGVTCVDCHIKGIESTERTAHTVPDHSFDASLESCNTCHEQDMHSAEQQGSNGTVLPAGTQPNQDVQLASVTPEPTPVSPVGFSALAGLLGLAGGMVLAPWLERWYQKVTKHDREDNND